MTGLVGKVQSRMVGKKEYSRFHINKRKKRRKKRIKKKGEEKIKKGRPTNAEKLIKEKVISIGNIEELLDGRSKRKESKQ